MNAEYIINTQIMNNPKEIINRVGIINGVFAIKIKCIGCSSNNRFLTYETPRIEDDLIIIDNNSFPYDLIENVEIKFKFKNDFYINRYKVANKYLKQFLNKEVTKKLKKHDLI